MNKKLYADKDYLDFKYIYNMSEKHGCSYIFIVGGRGTGKTYGALKYILSIKEKMMFMRRRQVQYDIIRTDEMNPFKALNIDQNTHIKFYPITKYTSSIFDSYYDENSEKYKPTGDSLGLAAALSTFANLRGFDGSDIDVVVYDEFIPEKHERPLKGEAKALFNALETIGRNRELQGKKPLKLLALANSEDISNPIFVSLGLVTAAEKMMESGLEVKFLHDKKIMLVIPQNSPISAQKARTALYALTQNTSFADMALHNNFVGVCKDCVESRDLREYKLNIVVGEICIYKHKSKREYYVTDHVSGVPRKIYTTSENQLKQYNLKNRDLWQAYIMNRVTFETYTLQVLFEMYHKM